MDREQDRILVIDGEKHMVELLDLYLRKAGFQVSCAFDAEAGIREFDLFDADLVIVDDTVPGNEYLDVVRRIRAGSTVPVIILGSHGSQESRDESYAVGADDFISKPFRPRDMISVIKLALMRARLRR